MSRADELNERYDIIQKTLGELYGPQRAMGAATAAWLMALQHVVNVALHEVRKQPEKPIEAFHDELEEAFLSFHRELCRYLGVETVDVILLAKAFNEVIQDIHPRGERDET